MPTLDIQSCVRQFSPIAVAKAANLKTDRVQCFGSDGSGLTVEQQSRLEKVLATGVFPPATDKAYCTFEEAQAILRVYGSPEKAKHALGVGVQTYNNVVRGHPVSAYTLLKIKAAYVNAGKPTTHTPAPYRQHIATAQLTALRDHLAKAIVVLDDMLASAS